MGKREKTTFSNKFIALSSLIACQIFSNVYQKVTKKGQKTRVFGETGIWTSFYKFPAAFFEENLKKEGQKLPIFIISIFIGLLRLLTLKSLIYGVQKDPPKIRKKRG
jgi:hypothetical protein